MESAFLGGVIEGFYGPPWSQGERFELFGQMARWGLNTYLYAPKDDPHHRLWWRKLYGDEDAARLKELIVECRRRSIRFIYALGPGLDLRYSDHAELACLKERIDQLRGLGCVDFALLFDDIPDVMRREDGERFGTFANAQCFLANTLFGLLPAETRFFFCPTPYCGRMAKALLGGPGYLAEIGEKLAPGIDIFWTGPEIVSREITVEHVREMAALLRRKPVIWDNLHANDYDGRRFYCGPYSGRPLELRDEVRGILSNPNCEFPLNYVPIKTLGNFIRGDQTEPRQQYLDAMGEWLWSFETIVGKPLTVEALVLFGDSFYLPYEDGLEAEWMFAKVKNAVGLGPKVPLPELSILKNFCARLPELSNRPLFYALSRRAWELREELDLIEKYLARPGDDFRSDFHLPQTYRGGFVARLQMLLKQNEDGTFTT